MRKRDKMDPQRMHLLGWKTSRAWMMWVRSGAFAALLTPLFTSAPAQPAYPRLANLYLHGSVHREAIDALARWDLLVLSTAWAEADLAKLRAANPDIQLFLYVNPYSVSWPADTSDSWARANVAYAEDNDLWWYDRDGNPASDWPGSRMVNITEQGASGSQGSWRAFMGQRIAGLVAARPSLDGIMLDNFWRRLSWNQGQLQLDSDCNPTHNPTGCEGSADTDSVLDGMWNRALAQLASDLRHRFDTFVQRARPVTLIGNGATDYYAWINGSLHESFPSGWAAVDYGNPYNYNWKIEMFGPEGGYLTAPFRDSPQQADILNAAFAGSTSQPSRSAEFERHKRFTLASALLGDGYYSLDPDTAGGHGALWWEPEYDHAGRGTGYLGQPLGAWQRLIRTTGVEIVQNGGFTDGLDGWIWHPNAADAAMQVDTSVFRSGPAAARMHVRAFSAENGELKVWHDDLVLQQDSGYTLTLWTRADRDMDIAVELYSTDCPKNLCLPTQELRATHEWTQHVLSFIAPANTLASLTVFVRAAGTVWIDDVSLRSGSSDVFRRDFANGIVLLNYTNELQTLALDEPFTRLDIPGSAVLDGAVVVQETLPAWDSRILLRTVPPSPPVSPQGHLRANEPNPFNPGTRIRFSLDRAQHVRLAVYDLRGKLVRDLQNGTLPAGENYAVVWDGTDRHGRPARTGVYLYRLIGADFSQARKMTLLR